MISVSVTDISQVAEARREAVGLAKSHGFGASSAGRVAIVATELSTNLVKHGGGGHILVTAFDSIDGTTGIEIFGIDQGPGISNLDVSLLDGVSSAGTAGNGLGAIKRQSHSVEIFSQRGSGTVIIARLLNSESVRPADVGRLPPWGVINVPMPGETVSGDGWAVRREEGKSTLMVVDGLGHGPNAARVAAEALRLFDKHWRSGPADTLRSLHAGLRATRGGAIAIARIEPDQRRIIYAGVGNIAGTIVSRNGQMQRMMSHNGTVGHHARQIQELTYKFEDPGSFVVLHSDGISGSWSAANYPGLAIQHPAVWAAVLYRDFARGRDDATVLVAKVQSE